ncbi:hypothetical protein ACQ86N_23035 [Puia sp. P3]|uniref:hypothetical protein n=1 Tax=Puia sp. P3 TaxID=3423952 RepID=UPI003D67643F
MARRAVARMLQIPSLKRTKITSRLVEISPYCKVNIIDSDAFIDEVTPWVYGLVNAFNDYLSWEIDINEKQEVTVETTIELWRNRNRLKEQFAGNYILTTTLHNLIGFLKQKGIEVSLKEVALRLKKAFEEDDDSKTNNRN